MEQKKEYWKWREYKQIFQSIEIVGESVITAGIDVGSVSSKAVIMVDGRIYSLCVMRTGSSSSDSAEKVLNCALEGTGLKLSDIHYIVGTGYGRVNVPMAKKTITEISCHAKGANFIWGNKIRVVLDIGGQDIKAIRIDESGNVVSFLMNDKCAAGTGRGMEIFADLLSIPIEEIGERSLMVEGDIPTINCTCVIFAKTEAIGLLCKGFSKDSILAAYCDAMALRIYNLLKSVGIQRELVITGGQSKNIGIVKRIEKLVGFETLGVGDWYKDGRDPMVAGAIGAAIFAETIYRSCQK